MGEYKRTEGVPAPVAQHTEKHLGVHPGAVSPTLSLFLCLGGGEVRVTGDVLRGRESRSS